MNKSIQIGDLLPEFTLTDQYGKEFSPKELIGKKNMVIYFYPKDETLVCTKQACSFRDNYEEFKELGCEVIGISSDNEDSHSSFSTNHRLPFILLSDKNKSVRKKFGVPKDLFGLLSGRYTYVFNKEGKLIHVFNDHFSAGKHIKEAINALKNASKESVSQSQS